LRKTNLARLLARRPDGIFLAPFEQGEIGPDLFRKACEFGLEGLVSKHRDRSCRNIPSPIFDEPFAFLPWSANSIAVGTKSFG
jgi:hypothetical protein